MEVHVAAAGLLPDGSPEHLSVAAGSADLSEIVILRRCGHVNLDSIYGRLPGFWGYSLPAGPPKLNFWLGFSIQIISP